jgi:hypothetical protein
VSRPPIALIGILSLVVAACGGDGNTPTQPTPVAGAATIGFNDAGGHGSPLVIYRESGFLVLPYSGPWTVNRNYGKPAPFIVFVRGADEDTTTGEIRVTADGARFRFTSIDLYSSITTIPYVITGFLGTTSVFTMIGTIPNTLGNFATVVNPNARDVVDGLVIRISDPQCTLIRCLNPVGLDNIVVGY